MKRFTRLASIGAGILLLCGAANAEPSARIEVVPNTKILRLDPQLDKIIAPGTPIERVATGFVFIEGPMWHDGALWFSDLSGNKLYSLTPGANGKLKVVLNDSGGLKSFAPGSYKGSNAMVTDKDGSVLVCQDGLRRIVRLSPDGRVTPFLEKYKGKRFNSPNDLVFAPDGALWFTDPPYGFYDAAHPKTDLDKNPAKELTFNGVFRYKDGNLTPMITDLPRPNGIGFSPDGKILYISNTEPKALILSYDISPSGKPVNRKVIADLTGKKGIGVPDGLKVDSKGDLWATGPGGIRIFAPDGKLLGQIVLPEVASNITWGGPDLRYAYIMDSTSVYRIAMKIPGEKPLYEK